MNYKKIIGFVLVVCIFHLTGCTTENTAKPDAVVAADGNSRSKTVQDANNAATTPERKVRIVLVGDSTVTDNKGWGLGFKRFLTDRAECINAAASGRSSKSFINEGRWAQRSRSKAITIWSSSATTTNPAKVNARQTPTPLIVNS